MDIQKALDYAKQWAREAGALQLEYLNKKIKYDTKSTAVDMVTEVDLLCEKLIISKIREVYPLHSIISEEAGKSNDENEYVWIIDPLDGTNNYFHGYPVFAVSIALHQGDEPLIGVVYVPYVNEMFYAAKEMGAYLNDEKITVSATDNLRGALLATGFPYDKAEDLKNNNIEIFSHIVPDIMGVRRSGSAAYDLCCAACGRLDGYWELKIKLWDMAAGELIMREAGGEVLYNVHEKGINIIAGNSAIVKLLQAKIHQCHKAFLGS
ncbi:MAG TPA: inositol monophosphatase family protein [Patescibacteria group bacterium]|nr:inositol monophosphatase family protein [Patescibacteria group bacterium]